MQQIPRNFFIFILMTDIFMSQQIVRRAAGEKGSISLSSLSVTVPVRKKRHRAEMALGLLQIEVKSSWKIN